MATKRNKFEDLEFTPHPIGGINAFHEFPNGYGVSVIAGSKHFYCGEGTYEVAITKDGELDYKTEFTDDVLAYQSPEEITELMTNLKKL